MKPKKKDTPLQPEDFATPEQIERNYQRIAKIGDRGRSGNLLTDWEAEERARQTRERAEYYRLQDEEFGRRQALRLAGPEEVEPAAVPVSVPAVIPAGNACFDFHATGQDLPLFAG